MLPGYHSIILFGLFILLQFGILKHFQASTTLTQRFQFWFGRSNLFRLFRYMVVFNFIFLTIHNLFSKVYPGTFTPLLKFRPVIEPSEILHWLFYFGLAIILFVGIYFYSHNKIRARFSSEASQPVHFSRGLRDYVFSSLLMNLGLVIIALVTFYLLKSIDEWFLRNGMSQLDWSLRAPNEIDTHKPGFYFAFLVAAAAWLFMISAFTKTRDKDHQPYNVLKVILLSSVLFFGLFSGIYSITNTIYNIRIHGDINKWYTTDKQLGFFAIRLSSLVLLYHLMRFLLKNVFHTQLKELMLLTFQPKGKLNTKSVALSDDEYSTIFFAQLGFYILNVSVAELSILFQGEKIYRTILDFSLVFIIDDFMIINEYSKKFGQILKWHRLRISIANAVLFVGGVITLIQLNLIWYLLLYISISIILLYVSRTNRSRAVTV